MKKISRLPFLLASAFVMLHQAAFPQETPAHVRSSFHFKLGVSLERAAPLFGPEGERCWAGEHWDPQFLHPQPAKDVEGAVFMIQHGPVKSFWVNTVFDIGAGRMQYVSFIPDALVTTIDVRLTAAGSATTAVEVTYTRTALSRDANDQVRHLASNDQDSGARWQQAIEACLAK